MTTSTIATTPFEMAFVHQEQQYRRQFFSATLIALGIEVALILLLVLKFSFFAQSGNANSLDNQITLVEEVEKIRDEPKKQPVVEKTKTVPTVQKKEIKQVVEKTQVVENGLPMVEERREISPPAAHPATTDAAAPSAAAAVAPSVNAEYIAKIRAAVQNAFVYPAAASALGFHGKVKLRFHLSHKMPSNPSILVGSGMGLIDKAAMQSVMSAIYPEPPSELKNTDMDCEVWIEYRP